MTRTLKEMGYTNITVVKEQEQPDGKFPTCPYPNPEIKEAMVKKYSMKNCKRCYILADASKFDQLSSVKFADFDQATILTTELYKPALKKYKNIVEVKE